MKEGKLEQWSADDGFLITDKRVVFGSLWLGTEQIVRLLLGMAVTVALARSFGVELFGLWSAALGYLAILNALSSGGVREVLVNRLALAGDENVLLSASATLLAIFGCSSFGLVIALYWSVGGSNAGQLALLTLLLSMSILFKPFEVFEYWFESQAIQKPLVISRMLSLAIYVVGVAILIFFDANITSIACLFVFERACKAFFLSAAFVHAYPDQLSFKFKPSILAHLIGQTWPLAISALAVVGYLKVDVLMLQSLSGSEVAGFYAAATRLSEAVYVFPAILMQVLAPQLAQLHKINPRRFQLRLQLAYDVVIVGGLLVAVLFTTFNTLLIDQIFGAGFSASANILAIHAWSAVFMFMGFVNSRWHVIAGMQTFTLTRTVFGLLLNVCLNLILIPSFGASGAACATVVSYAFTAMGLDIVNPCLRPILLMKLNSFLVPFALARLLRPLRAALYLRLNERRSRG